MKHFALLFLIFLKDNNLTKQYFVCFSEWFINNSQFEENKALTMPRNELQPQLYCVLNHIFHNFLIIVEQNDY